MKMEGNSQEERKRGKVQEKKLLMVMFLWLCLVYFVKEDAPREFLQSCVWAFSVLTFATFFMREIMKPGGNLGEILKSWLKK